MKLGALVAASTPEETIEEVTRLGLSATGIHLSPGTVLDHDQAAMLGDRARAAGVQLSQFGCYINLECAPGPLRDRLFARLREVATIAGAAGARCVISGVGHLDPAQPEAVWAAHPDNWTDRAMGRLIDSCVEAAEIARQAGTTFCVETWVITTLNTPQRVGELVRKVGTDGFGILLDPVNLMSLYTHFDNTRVIQQCFDEAGDAIRLVHAKDTKLVPGKFTYHMSEVPPGDGVLDYSTLLRCMDKLTDATTPLLIEHLPDTRQIEAARDHIRKVAESVSVTFQV